ncbi:hypothetical protein AB0M54_11885 [Actinoplanes sp. NPDC051470]|uniref:hypothetical protein n=1 Tax=Actinoplanes sp. NPDC051470 TaxID=3157224 RepID=UPI0034310C9C
MRRLLTGAVALFLAASAVTLTASPASAGPEDELRVAIELSSGKVVAGGTKQVTFTITNISDDDLWNPVLEFEENSWDHDRITIAIDREVCDAGGWIGDGCALTPNPLLPGRSATFTTTITGGAVPGPAGNLRVLFVYRVGWDPQDFATFPLSVESGPGPDLYAQAADVPADGALEPGQTAPLEAAFANRGNVPATDVKVTATLPAGARFRPGKPPVEGCETTARTVTCDFGDAVLPAKSDLIPLSFPVRLDDNAKRGVNLKGGKVTITGRAATPAEVKAAPRSFPTPLADIDLADNDDTFVIVVVPGDDESPGGGAGGGDGDDDPVLPITGPGPAVGAGALLLALGAFLILLGRRREGVG